MIRVCFVCLGNICRSPTAEAVMRSLVAKAGLVAQIDAESAGTSRYHVGEPRDPRASAAAKSRGVELSGRARQFTQQDWDRFDYVLAMDRSNHEDLANAAPAPGQRAKLHLLRDFDPASPKGASVADPYYGGDSEFAAVLEVCEAACAGLLARVRAEHGL